MEISNTKLFLRTYKFFYSCKDKDQVLKVVKGINVDWFWEKINGSKFEK